MDEPIPVPAGLVAVTGDEGSGKTRWLLRLCGLREMQGVARALAQQADLYFMDEPFTGVDAATERAIVTLLEGLRAKGGTIVAVHHDLTTAPEYFDRVILLNMRLVAAGPVDEVFTAELLQKTYGGRLTVLSELALRAQAARARRTV